MSVDIEIKKLRGVISKCAESVGAYISEDGSAEFAANLPQEITLVIEKVTVERDNLRALLAKQPESKAPHLLVASEIVMLARQVESNADGSTMERQNALCYAANIMRGHAQDIRNEGSCITESSPGNKSQIEELLDAIATLKSFALPYHNDAGDVSGYRVKASVLECLFSLAVSQVAEGA